MLRIYNKNHSAIGYIQNYKDLKIECDVRTGDKTLYFTYLGNKVEENPQPVQAFTDAQEQILTDTNQEVYCAGIEEPGYEALVPAICRNLKSGRSEKKAVCNVFCGRSNHRRSGASCAGWYWMDCWGVYGYKAAKRWNGQCNAKRCH